MQILQEASGNRRWRLTHRLLPALGIVCGIAFIFGLFKGATHVSDGEKNSREFVKAWEKGDYASMYSKIAGGSKSSTTEAEFKKAYETARDTATATSIDFKSTKEEGDDVVVPATV